MPEAAPVFLFVCCQVGAEATCKEELQQRYPGLRPAFSRPGFLTFKCDETIQPAVFSLVSTFARTWGWSAGKVAGTEASVLASQLLSAIGPEGFSLLHCWQRDSRVPGEDGFEPGPTPLAIVAAEAIRAAAAVRGCNLEINRRAKPGEKVLDVILVEPGEWWFGWHTSGTVVQSWPGGVPLLNVEDQKISRAWLKISEAVLWGQVPIRAGDAVAEIGSAPGGAAQYLLDRGTHVVAIDPAEMDPAVTSHPNLIHIRRRARDVPRRDLADIRWLVIDVNMPPSYTLEVLADYLQSPHLHVRGVIVTFKLSDWKLASEIEAWRERVRELGFQDVRTRQLAFNRQEICLVALRNRYQRRLASGSARTRGASGSTAEGSTADESE